MVLNATFLHIILGLYAGDDTKVHNHYLLSPKFTPDEILAEYPPCRFIIGGLDPLRDESLRFALRLLKHKIDVKLTEYRYCLHGFMSHFKSPYYLKETKDCKKKANDYILDLIYNT